MPAETALRNPPALPRSVSEAFRIVVVSPDRERRGQISKELEGESYALHSVERLKDAYALIELAQKPVLVALDVGSEVADAQAFLRSIALLPATVRVGVLAIAPSEVMHELPPRHVLGVIASLLPGRRLLSAVRSCGAELSREPGALPSRLPS